MALILEVTRLLVPREERRSVETDSLGNYKSPLQA